MVSKRTYKTQDDPDGGPPPLDESWWEAILAEEDKYFSPAPKQSLSPFKAKTKAPEPSFPSSPAEIDWKLAMELYEQDKAISLQVYGYNRGGLLVCNERLQGFVPISHLVEMPVGKSAEEQEQFLKSYSGRRLHLKVIECDPQRGRVVFSERAALARPGSRNLLFSQLQPGQCTQGVVTNITDFGVFVDLGGVEGLIHVSELSWGRVRHPADVVRYGEQVKVYVLNVDPDRARVGLSIKRLHPNPWETAEERYFITSIVPFGAFARLEEGLDGLIHISEIRYKEGVTSLSDMLREGQRVKVRVLHVDASKQRLGLSLVTDES
jgi:small subunit ribosomal protein S1